MDDIANAPFHAVASQILASGTLDQLIKHTEYGKGAVDRYFKFPSTPFSSKEEEQKYIDEMKFPIKSYFDGIANHIKQLIEGFQKLSKGYTSAGGAKSAAVANRYATGTFQKRRKRQSGLKKRTKSTNMSKRKRRRR